MRSKLKDGAIRIIIYIDLSQYLGERVSTSNWRSECMSIESHTAALLNDSYSNARTSISNTEFLKLRRARPPRPAGHRSVFALFCRLYAKTDGPSGNIGRISEASGRLSEASGFLAAACGSFAE